MSVSRLLKKFGQTSHVLHTSTDSASSPSADDSNKSLRRRQANEPTPTIIPHFWRKTLHHPRMARSTPTLPLAPDSENSTSERAVPETSLSMPLHASPSDYLTTPAVEPPPGIIPAIIPVPDKLTAAWDAVKDDPKGPNVSRGLDGADDEAVTVQDNAAPFMPIITATVLAAQQTDVAKAVKEGIDKLAEGMPVFMKALDELKSLHPAIGGESVQWSIRSCVTETTVVVLVFKTVYTLELKRRENDKKILSLFVGMRDMMGALFLLKDIENDKVIGPNGISLEDRLKVLVDRTADDIKTCSNVCDAYTKKRPLAKVLLSSVWDARLLEFVQLFANRRKEFEFELTMHASQGIDNANAKLDAIGEALNEQMDAMKALFQQLVSPEQKRLSELVAAKGGVKALKEDDKLLFELEKAERQSVGYIQGGCGTHVSGAVQGHQSEDIFEDPSIAVEKNLSVFSRKFEAQRNQIVDELALVVKRESDRVIQEVKGGPHERILDRSVHEIWTEMGWRGNVKARHFVLAFRDYYLERLNSGAKSVLGMSTSGINHPVDPDAWAVKYIDIIRLQPIMEAIDDDSSGFITIGEMNRFTASRPIDWSLPHWVAYWAVGFRASIIDYAHKIEELYAKMDGIRTEVPPLNRQAIITYFAYTWQFVHSLIAPLLSLESGKDDNDKFKSYLEAEEARLGNNLNAVDYIIDGTDTLTLITGTVFPLLYLLMKRHYEIMRTMRTKVLDSRVLWENKNSIDCVQEALIDRVVDLMNNFTQQKLDVEKKFKDFAYGMFTYIYDPATLWAGAHMLDLDPQTTPYDDANEDQTTVVDEFIRLFEISDEPSLDYWVYDGHSIEDVPNYGNVESPLKEILGHWHGYFYESGGIRETQGTDSMVTLVLEPAEGERDFKANAWSNRGRFTINGSWSVDDNKIMQIAFKMKFRTGFWIPIFFSGHFDPDRDALTGVWGYSADPEGSMGPLEFRRIPPRYLTVYPSPALFGNFAISAVRNDIRQQRYSWSYFAQRRDDRETVVSFSIRYLFFGKPLDQEEIQRLCTAVQRLTSTDACFYGSMVNRKRVRTLIHEFYCDYCGGFIGGTRLFCVDCITKSDTFNTVDFCYDSDSRCIEERIDYRDDLKEPHEPSHWLVKLRTSVAFQHLGGLYKSARAAIERVEELLPKIVAAAQQSAEQKETGEEGLNASTQDGTATEQPPEREEPEPSKSDDVPTAANGITMESTRSRLSQRRLAPNNGEKRDDASTATDDNHITDGVEAEPTVVETPGNSEKRDIAPTATDDDGITDGVEAEPTVVEAPSNGEKRDDAPTATDDDGITDGVEAEPTVVEAPSNGEKRDVAPTATDDNAITDGIEAEPTVAEAPAPTANGDANGAAETEDQADKVSQAAPQAQSLDGDSRVPMCGVCDGALSFPLWYCIFCEDNLFICDACDAKGVPDITRSSGKHTEEHHLLRCLEPDSADETVSSQEQRLIAIEGRLADIQTQFDTTTSSQDRRLIAIEGRLADMQSHFDTLTAQIGKLEGLLHKLVGVDKSDAE
ncbi:hypothetical protein F5148DRAFT_1153428 [Russula earlei]|uniref:Uncharacterized protein n=1 Tax=Russula earlei TaxID=71964 RepID=A0ACC0TTR8_9AGAM|nr:hypothetical protein F5148DRAFT_1153428 [Russula earlei]